MFLIAEVLHPGPRAADRPGPGDPAPGLQPLRLAATLYVDVFRGVPTLLLVFLIGFGLPALQLQGTPSQPLVLGAIALVLSYSAYVGGGVPGRAELGAPGAAQRRPGRSG